MAPTNLTASAICEDSITITWTDNSTNEDNYLIHLDDIQIATLASNSITFNITGLTPNTSYKLATTAVNTNGHSAQIITAQTLSAGAGCNLAPVASNVSISGTTEVGQTLTGSYSYTDAESDIEGVSSYTWLRSDDSNGLNKTIITGQTGQTYTLTTGDLNKYISFLVVPVAVTGSLVGTAVESAYTTQITTTGPGVPASPTILQATTTTTTATVDWTDNATNEDGYRVYEGANLVDTLAADSTTYTFT